MTSEITHKKENSQISYPVIWVIYLIAYLALGLLPAVKYSVPYIIAGLFTMLPMAIISLKRIDYRLIFVFLVGLGFIQGLVTYISGNGVITELINEPIRNVRFFVPCVLFDIVSKMNRKKQLTLWIIASALMGFVIIKTLIAVEIDPMIARVLAQGALDEELMEYRMDNIGGFGNCYAVCITFGMWAYFMFNSKLWMRITSIVMLIFLFYFTVQVQYMSMLLLCIAAFLAVVLICAKKPLTKIFAVVFTVGAMIFMPMFLRWVADFGVGNEIYRKLMNIAATMDGTMSLSDSTSRVELYKAALLDFVKSPIWGTFESQAAATSHSTILSIASTTGILGLLCYSYGVFQCYKVTRINLEKNDVDSKVFKVIFLMFLILAVINPIHYIYEISIVLLLYIPLTLLMFSRKDKATDEEGV